LNIDSGKSFVSTIRNPDTAEAGGKTGTWLHPNWDRRDHLVGFWIDPVNSVVRSV
jgi:hypothetical protein